MAAKENSIPQIASPITVDSNPMEAGPALLSWEYPGFLSDEFVIRPVRCGNVRWSDRLLLRNKKARHLFLT